MNKKELIDFLEGKLSILNKSERDDIISEYIQHIDNKMAEGLTEKEAVETLGSIDDLVRDILAAYNVDPDYYKDSESEINAKVSNYFNRFTMGIKAFGDYVVGQKFETLFVLFIKSIILFFVLIVCFEIGKGICMFFSSLLGGWSILRTIVGVMYTVVAVPTILYIFIKFIAHSTQSNKNINVNNENIVEDTNEESDFNIKTEKVSVKKVKKQKPDFDFSFGEIIKNIIVFALKVFVVMCLLPCIFTLIFTVIGFGGLLVMCFAGYPFIGLTIGFLGFNLVAGAILLLIIRLIFFNKVVSE